MDKHTHIWKLDGDYCGGSWMSCSVEGCNETMWADDMENRINATERLKGYRAKGAALCLEGAGCSNYTDELVAYADILDGK